MESRSIICRSPRLRQIIDLRDTSKSRDLAITEFNNSFIIQSPSLFFIIIFSLIAQGSDLPFSHKSVVSITHEQNIICSKTLSKTQLDSIAHKQTIICRQIYVDHVVCCLPMKRNKNMHRMKIYFLHFQGPKKGIFDLMTPLGVTCQYKIRNLQKFFVWLYTLPVTLNVTKSIYNKGTQNHVNKKLFQRIKTKSERKLNFFQARLV